MEYPKNTGALKNNAICAASMFIKGIKLKRFNINPNSRHNKT